MFDLQPKYRLAFGDGSLYQLSIKQCTKVDDRYVSQV